MAHKIVTVNKLILTNYKKHKHIELDFHPVESTIIGPNGDGKSTFWDAYNFLFTGKDLEGKSNFEIKPWIDKINRKTEPHVVVAVEGHMTNDGDPIVLRKEMHEKWVPTSDEDPTPKYESDTFVYYINKSKVKTKTEWDSRLSAIYPTIAFSAVTNPDWLFRLKVDEMRKVVIDMIGGDIKDEEIVERNPSYKKLVEKTLKTRTIDGYKKEINDNIKSNQQQADAIPKQIEDKKNDIAKIISENNFDEIEKEIPVKRKIVEELDAQIEELSNSDEGKVKVSIQNKIKDFKDVKQGLENVFNNQKKNSIEQLRNDKRTNDLALNQKTSQIIQAEANLKKSGERIVLLNKNREDLVAEWHLLNNKKFPSAVVSEDGELHAPDCEHCKRGFTMNEYREYESVLIEAFNKKNKELKDAINEKGKTVKADILAETDNQSAIQKSIIDLEKERDNLSDKIKSIEQDISKKEATSITDDEKYQKVVAEIAAEEVKIAELDGTETEKQLVDLREKRATAGSELEELNRKLGKRDAIQIIEKSIAEHEENLPKVIQTVLDWKKAKKLFDSFLLERAAMLEEKVNSMFKHMKFAMFKYQNDGTPEVTCVPTLNGTSYTSVNTGFLPMMYIDVANAFAERYGIAMPVFLDNMESVKWRPDTICQVINIVFPKFDEDVTEIKVIEGEYKPKKQLA